MENVKLTNFRDAYPELNRDIVAFDIDGVDYIDEYSGYFTKEKNYDNYSIGNVFISWLSDAKDMYWMYREDYDKAFRDFIIGLKK